MTDLDTESDVDGAPSHSGQPRPVSRDRARKSRGRLTVEPGPHALETAPGGEPPEHGRAPRERKTVVHPSRMWPFVCLTILCVGALFVLAWQGYTTSLDIKGGSDFSDVTDPAKPGYQALVKPTPTHLVITTDAEGKVGDAYLLVEGSGSADAASVDGATTTSSDGSSGTGGAVLFIPGKVVVTVDGEPFNLTQLAEAKGMPAVVDAIQAALGIGVTDAVQVGPDQIAELVSSAGPITVDNPDPLVSEDTGETVFPEGAVELQPDEVAEYLGFLNVGEAIVNRPVRGQAVWEAWLAKLAEPGAGSPTLAPVPSIVDGTPVDLASLVGGLSQGQVEYEQLPVDRLTVPDMGGFSIYQPNTEAIAETMARIVPFPGEAFAGQRPRVRLFNGTSDPQAPLRAAQPIVSTGSQIVVLGNAPSFDVAKTRVEYNAADQKQAAQAVADALGVGAAKPGVESDAVDVTVTLGSDYTG